LLLNKKTHIEKLIRRHQFAKLTITHAYTETQIEAPLLLQVINPIHACLKIIPQPEPSSRSEWNKAIKR
jgi:hypothetical protein